MIDRFPRLIHDPIICSNNEYDEIRYLGTPGSHRGKGFMPRGINERDELALAGCLVGTYVLRNPSGLAVHYIFFSDSIQQ